MSKMSMWLLGIEIEKLHTFKSSTFNTGESKASLGMLSQLVEPTDRIPGHPQPGTGSPGLTTQKQF